MRKLKDIAKRIPGVPFLYYKYVELRLRLRSTEDVFTDLYVRNEWGGKESISGSGSDDNRTRVIINEVAALLRDFNIHTMLDIPCGDFHWMRHVNMESRDYTGADIVMDLVQKNKEKYEKENIRFCKLNLIKDKLPRVDLILCRDCLLHFSFKDIFRAFHNLCDSESTYLLTTTFTSRQHNHDITTGKWRTLNLEVAPFMLPSPLKVINEECTQDDGAYKDKSLGLWRLADIRERLTKRAA